MKKHRYIAAVALLAAVLLWGCSNTLQFSHFGTDSKTLLKNISSAAGEKVPDFTLYDKTQDGVFVYLTRLNNVYLTVYASETYNMLRVALAFDDLTDATITTFGVICGAVIATIDPLADPDALIEALDMEAYALNVANTYESENIQYAYTTTSSAIFFTMYKD